VLLPYIVIASIVEGEIIEIIGSRIRRNIIKHS